MGKKVFSTLLLLLLFFSVCMGCSSSYQIQGYVYENYSGEPLPNIPIVFNSSIQTTTNQKGAYSVDGINTSPVHVEIEGGKRWNFFQDDVLLDKGMNHRDFFLESIHPLGFLESEIEEPYSLVYRIEIGNSEEEILQSAVVESIPMELSVHIKGYEIGLDQKKSPIEIVQIGMTGWSLDSYGNWNETIDPGDSLIRFDLAFQDEMMIIDTFYKDLSIAYTDLEETVVIDDIKTRVFEIEYKEEESGFTRNMTAYIIEEGPFRGNIKKLISYHPQKSQYQYVIIHIESYNEIESIFPPVITK